MIRPPEIPEGTTVTVGRLARRFGLSRSTLLYYDRIGLLRPSSGGDGAYRRYSAADAERLAAIVRYRAAGVPLTDIARLLDGPADGVAGILRRRLERLEDEVGLLREQQRVIAGLLCSEEALPEGVMTRRRWTRLLEAAGFDELAMRRWHVGFERSAPDEHRRFLEQLGIPEAEIAEIRSWRDDGPP